jgi:hypothetical protein
MAKELYDFACQLVHETDGAYLLDDGTKEVWFPKSVVELEKQHDGTYVATIPVKWAKDKELI